MRTTVGARWSVLAALGMLGGMLLIGTPAQAVDYSSLGKKLLVKGNLPSGVRKVIALAKETSTDISASGQKGLDLNDDPSANGATLTISVDGATPSSQTFNLSAGLFGGSTAPGWKVLAVGFKYLDPKNLNGPVKVLLIKRTPADVFLMKAVITGEDPGGPGHDVTIEPPNGGTPSGTMSLQIDGGGNQYCSAWGGAAGGTVNKNDLKTLIIVNPTTDIGCTGAPACSTLEFTTSTGAGDCGDITDTSGGGGTSLTPYGEGSPGLKCGSLYIGGGVSVQPPSAVPANATSVFKITDCSTATAYVLAPTTAGETGSSRTCTSPGCTFGPPLPIPNPGVPAISTCVINSIAASPAAGGTLDTTTGDSTQTLPLSVLVHVTGDLEGGAGIQPCPTCSGTCNSGPNSGSGCTTTWSGGTTHDCPPPSATSLPIFGVDLSPLGTTTVALDSATGNFCGASTGQRTNGCFGLGTCEHIEQTGSAGAISQGGGPVATTLGSVFCIPSSGNMLIDTVADLPGPGSVSLPGDAEIP